MSTRLRWKKDPPETGLRAIGARPRGYHLHDGAEEYATIRPNGGGWQSEQKGWMWIAYSPRKVSSPIADLDQAKREALAYVKAHAAKEQP